MRIGPLLLLTACLALAGSSAAGAGREEERGDNAGSAPRSPTLLRQIFGDGARSAPGVWGVVSGMRRSQIPPDADLGQEEKGAGAASAFVRAVGGRATVSFVFDGREADPRLNHITVTLFEAPSINPRTVRAHLSKIYGPPDAEAADRPADRLGSWLNGRVLLDFFPAARFFEIRLIAPPPS